MLVLNDLKKAFTEIDFREKRPNVYKILIPFYHEDGDMYDIFVEECPEDKGLLRLSDYGLTLMKLSYTFDIDTSNKEEALNSIVIKNRCNIDDGNIYLDISPEHFNAAIYQLIQVISKVSNMDIISREASRSMFYELLDEYILTTLKLFNIKKDVIPTKNPDLKVDYEIPGKKPLYVFGVNDNPKASKVVITCLNFNNEKIPYKSLIINENFDELSGFNKSQIINIGDKSYTNLDEFKQNCAGYIQREFESPL